MPSFRLPLGDAPKLEMIRPCTGQRNAVASTGGEPTGSSPGLFCVTLFCSGPAPDSVSSFLSGFLATL
jgi:hypothetical protein